MKIPDRARFRLLSVGALLVLPFSTWAGNLPVWPLPNVPAGANAAVIPSPRSDWMLHFQHNLDHVKGQSFDLVFEGDSITDYWQAQGKDVWAQHYARLGATDFGISGDKTENVLWRLEDGQVDGLNPKLVVLLIGTNNLTRDRDDQIAEGVAKIVQEYERRCPRAAILLQGIFPRGAQASNPFRQRIKNINAMIAKLGDGKKVIYLDFGDKFLAADGSISPDIMPDALHPSPKGYEIWAAAIQPVIDQFFTAPH